MPQITVDISAAGAAKLQLIVDAHNNRNQTALSLADWLQLHLREMAVQDDVATAIQALQKQKEDELKDAIASERDRLLAAV
jgi:hypothetical protein